MDNKFLSILESIIPGKIPKVLSGLTIVLALVLLKYSPVLPFVSSPLTRIEEISIRLIPALLLLLAGGTLLVASLVYKIHKINNAMTTTYSSMQSLARTLLQINAFLDSDSDRVKSRIAVLLARLKTSNSVETIEELNILNESRYSIERMHSTILRYVDAELAQPNPVAELKTTAPSDCLMRTFQPAGPQRRAKGGA